MGGALPLVFGIQIKRIRWGPLFVCGGGKTDEKEQQGKRFCDSDGSGDACGAWQRGADTGGR